MFVFTLLLAACGSAASLCDVGNRLSLSSPALRDAVVSRLKDSGINFEVSADGTICYPSEARDEVTSIVVAEDLRANPPNRIRLAGGALANDVVAKLRAARIDFTQSEQDGYVFVFITREEDVPAAMDIAEDVARSVGSKAPR